VSSLSVDAVASAVTSSGAIPELGDTVSRATGAGSLTVTRWVAFALPPAPSVTVTVTVYVPAAR